VNIAVQIQRAVTPPTADCLKLQPLVATIGSQFLRCLHNPNAGGPAGRKSIGLHAFAKRLAPLVRETGEKNRTVVEYALYEAGKPIGVASYRIVKRLPKELKGELPTPAEIAKLLEDGE